MEFKTKRGPCEFCWPTVSSSPQVFSPSVYVDVALQKQLEELLNSCYYIPSKEEASKVEVNLPSFQFFFCTSLRCCSKVEVSLPNNYD